MSGVAATVLVLGVEGGFFALVALCAWLERWWNLRGHSVCCGAEKYGYYTPFGWVVRCGQCRKDC